MKKITLMLTFVFLYFCALCQSAAQEDIVLTLPQGTQTINEVQFKTFSESHFNQTRMLGTPDHLYKKDNMLFSYRILPNSPDPRTRHTLERLQRELMGGGELRDKEQIVDEMKIVTVNGTRFSIIRYHRRGDYFYWFFSDYRPSDFKTVNALLQFKSEDAAKAEQFVQEIMQKSKI